MMLDFQKEECSGRWSKKPSFIKSEKGILGAARTSFKRPKMFFTLIAVFLATLLLSVSVMAALDVALSNQATDVKDSNGDSVDYGNLTVYVYDAFSGGTEVYSEIFNNRIINGSWNVMIGANASNTLSLEYGKVYYIDYTVNGEDINFTAYNGSEVDRQFFYSPLGDISDEDINDATNLTLGEKITFALGGVIDNIVDGWIAITGNLNVTGDISLGNADKTLYAGTASSIGGIKPYTAATGVTTVASGGSGEGAITFRTGNSNTALTGGTERMRITLGGNLNLTGGNLTLTSPGMIGIGTAAPDGELHISATEGNNADIRLYADDGDDSADRWSIQSMAADNVLRFYNSVIGSIVTMGSGGNVNITSGNLTVPTGRVGIGTESPARDLHLAGSTNSLFILTTDNTGHTSADGTLLGLNSANEFQVHNYEDANITFSTNDAERVRITGEGNVGIGTESPDEALEVVGSIKLSGDIKDETYSGTGLTLGNSATLGANANLSFSVGDVVNAVRIQGSTGRVGIGTASPSAKLEVSGTKILLNSTGSANMEIDRAASSNAGNLVFSTDSSVDWFIANRDSVDRLDFIETSSGGERISIVAGGDVGIGTTTPQNQLDVEGSVAIGATYSGTSSAPTNGLIVEGNVGIGTTSPAQLLNVDGDANITGTLYAGAFSPDNLGVSNNVTVGGNLSVGAGTLFANPDTGNVGIGTASPGSKLDIYTGASGGGAFPNTQLTLESANVAGISMLGGANTYNIIAFGDSASNQAGYIMYDHDIDVMKFQTNSAEQMRIDSSGNVGIGTASPGSDLEVYGASAKMMLNSTDTEASVNLYTSGDDWYIQADSASDALEFNAAGVGIPMVIEHSTGNVGIGTASPADELHLEDGDFLLRRESVLGPLLTMEDYSDTSYNAPYLYFKKSHIDTMGVLNETADGDELGRINFMGVDSGNNSDSGAKIKVVQDGAASTRVPSNMYLWTFSDTAENTNQLVLHNDGNVGIGTENPQVNLHLNGTGNQILRLQKSAYTADLEIGSGSFFIGTGGTRRLTVDSSGKVGIGAESPASELYVNGSGLTDVIIDSAANNDAVLRFYEGGAQKWSVRNDVSNSDSLVFYGGADHVTFTTGGNVGIGTASPATALHTIGTIAINNTGNNYIGTYNPSELRLISGAATGGTAGSVNIEYYNSTSWLHALEMHNVASGYGDLLLMQDGGNVGIGTASPGVELHVNSTTPKISAYDSTNDDWITSSVDSSLAILSWGDSDNSVPLVFGTYSAFPDTGWSEKMRIASGGNVGIGTTTPQQTLNVVGSSNLTSSTGGGMYIDSSGNVNIPL